MSNPAQASASIRHWFETLDADAQEYFEERAAIVEYEAGQPREIAEAVAQRLTKLYLQRREGRHGRDRTDR